MVKGDQELKDSFSYVACLRTKLEIKGTKIKLCSRVAIF